MTGDSSGSRLDRRTFLATGVSGIAAATAGCSEDVQRFLGGDGAPLTLSITTVPADDDRRSIQLARHLERQFEAVGIPTSLDARTHAPFREAVYMDHQFDIFVGPHPGGLDPDVLYESLHSLYATEVGMQNPYGLSKLMFDELLEDQRGASGSDREAAVERLLDAFASIKPFIPICVPDEFRLARSDRFEGFDDGHLATRHGYLGLDQVGDETELTAIVTDSRPTINQNPFAHEYRMYGPITDLLYDSLATVDDGEYRPWLAESWTWLGSENASDEVAVRDVDGEPAPGPRAAVTVRPDCLFHDGEPVTAADVAFTYEFLADTTLGRADSMIPPTYYRGPGDIVHSVQVRDERTVEFTFAASQEVAKRALAVPILPEHLWRERVESTAQSALPTQHERWVPLASANMTTVGSGPYQFEDSTETDQLTLTRFDDHFSRHPNVSLEAPTAESIQFLVDPSSASAVQYVDQGPVDVTTSPLEPHVYEDAQATDGTDVIESPSQRFYHIGFNYRNSPLHNDYVRRTIARLVDREAIIDDIFNGLADPVCLPVGEEWAPEALRWDGEDPTAPFIGAGGELDVEAAKEAFKDIGFRYDSTGDRVVSY